MKPTILESGIVQQDQTQPRLDGGGTVTISFDGQSVSMENIRVCGAPNGMSTEEATLRGLANYFLAMAKFFSSKTSS